jgi:hypothetical protein
MAKQSRTTDKPLVNVGLIIGLAALLVVGIIVSIVKVASPKDPTLTAAPPIAEGNRHEIIEASPELLDMKRREAGEPAGGAPRKPAQPYTP